MGKKRSNYTDEEQAEMLALYIELESYAAVGEKLGITRQSVKTVIDRLMRDPEKKEYYEKHRKKFEDRFVPKAERIINNALDALEKEIDDILQRKRGVKLNELTSAIGTLYEKRALIKGETTEISSVQIMLPKEAEEYAE